MEALARELRLISGTIIAKKREIVQKLLTLSCNSYGVKGMDQLTEMDPID
jgi:hypothetical protein